MSDSARRASEGTLLEAPPDPHCSRGEVYVLPTSYAQRRLWFLDRFEPGSPLYNIPQAYRLEGPLDLAALAGALRDLARRHETLRTTFAEKREAPVQVVEAAPRLPVPVVDLSALPRGSARREGGRRVAAEARRPFDLGRGPLVRAAAVRLAPGRHLFLLTLHHAVADGWSLGVLRRELGALYRARRARPGAPAALPELPIQYADYAAWQEAWLAGEEMARQLDYWRARLAGAPEAMELPLAGPRPVVRDHRGGRLSRPVPGSVTGALEALARAEGATRFMVYLAAWKLLLHRLGHHVGRPDAVVGTPVAGRGAEETEGLIGLFVNTLALRTDCSGDPTFRELLARVKEGVLEAFAHQDLPFEKLVEALVPDRDLSYEPLVQVSFGLEEEGGAALDLPGVRAEPLEVDHAGVKLDLSLLVEERDGGLRATLSYARDLFEPADAERLLRCYAALLASVAGAPGRRVGELAVAPAAERHRVLVEWSAVEPVPGAPAPIHRLVEEQAERTPEAVAVVAGGSAVTYAELIRRSRELAARLSALGVGEEARVGLALARSPGLVPAMLAVLRCGGAYVPLDPGYPEERLALMVEDAAIRVLLAERATAGRLAAAAERSEARVLLLDEPPAEPGEEVEARPAEAEPEVPLDALAYVIYTSGSTGKPKGVAIAHRSAAAMIAWAGRTFGPDELSGLYAGTSVNFDLSVFELFVPLTRGGRVVLGEDSLALAGLAGAGAVRLVNTVPSAIAELVRLETVPASAATVNLAGEPLQRDLVERLYALPGVERVYNLYGPSEDTTYSTAERVPRGESGEPAIGRPVAGTRASVLDRDLRPVPAGIPGELCLAGAGLARGYLGRAARTAERFLPDPFAAAGGEPGGRIYRTGDLVRSLRDGRLAFLGRLDHQVKLRGFRIELGEVETVLAGHPGVAAAAVLLRPPAGGPSGEGRLTAYVAPAAGGPAPRAEELAGHLRRTLPGYMVPSAWVVLDALPLTPNGKIDRRALAAIEPEAPGDTGAPGGQGGGAPRSPEEEVLAELWADLLGVETVGVRQSFFELGGHSLLATRLVSRVRRLFGVEVPLRRLFERPTVAGIAALIGRGRGLAPAAAPPLEPMPREPPPAASSAQARLWFLARLGEDGGAYNLPAALALRGVLDAPELARALGAVVRRHEALRTVFAEGGPPAGAGGPLQVVLPEVPAGLAVVDLRGLPRGRREAASLRAAAAAAGRPFDLEAGPLFRFVLERLGAGEHLLVATFHHAVADGWSIGVFFRELAALYGGFRRGAADPAAELPALPVQYPDFAVWQRRWLAGGVLEEQLAYWRERLAGLPPLLELPADRPRESVRSPRGGRCPVALSAALVASLRELARSHGASLYMVCLAAFQALLGRLAGVDDLAVGTPIAGRTRAETEGLIGLFVNTLVLRGDLADDPSFAALVGRAREAALDAYAHQDLPFERLVEELRPERSLGHGPLVQVMLSLQNAFAEPPGLPGLEAAAVEVGRETAKLDLRLGLKERRGALEGEVEYRRDLFDAATVARWVRQLGALLEAAAAEPGRRLSELPLLPRAERHALLHEWSGGASAAPSAAPLFALVARRAEERPDAVAVEAAAGQLTYAGLLGRAEELAGRLAAAGAGPDRPAAVFLDRSPELVVALLAAARAAAPAVPLDPDYPAGRLAFMLKDSAAAVVVTATALRRRLPAGAAAVIELPPGPGASPRPLPGGAPPGAADALAAAAPAYVLYTSGSTGRPNGVAVPQAAVSEHLRAMTEALPLGPGDTVLYKTPSSFDPSVWELWAPLAAGARLALARPGGHREPAYLAGAVGRRRATVLRLVPGLFEEILREGGFDGCPFLRRLFVGGEALPPAAARRFLAASRAGFATELVNSYGPTETTVTAACHRVGEDDGEGALPIGRPVGHLRARVLDRRLRPAPLGAAGELALSGPTLASGYWRRPALTAERFLPDPFADAVAEGAAGPGSRLYRTGDRVRLRPDGRLVFLGRLDGQVKLRGVRVELGEVEALLAGHPAVARAAALVRDGAGAEGAGDRRLVAYAVLRPGAAATAGELRDALARALPPAAVPAAVVLLSALPLLPNGKIDRRSLAAAAPGPAAAGRSAVPPRGPLEELVAEVWSEVLGVDRVGAHDDFFDLGGHSLLATRVTARLRQRTGVEVPLRRLFEEPTVAALAAALGRPRAAAGGREEPAPPALVALPRRERPAAFAASFAQERLWFLDRFGEDPSAYNLPAPRRLRGALDLPALARALAALVRRHESLRTVLRTAPGDAADGAFLGSAAVQVIAPPGPVALPIADLRPLPEPARERELCRLALAEARRPFDLATGPLLRAAAVRLAADDHALLLALHHAVADGWSMGVLFRELAALYRAGSAPVGPLPAPELPALPVQYPDFAVWQRRWLSGEVLEAELAFWRERLAGAPAALELPADRPRPAVRRGRGGLVDWRLPEPAAAGLRGLARERGASLFMALLAGFQALLARVTGATDVPVGTPVANRGRAETEGLIGFFANTLVLRTDLGGDPTFAELLDRVREVALEAFTHQELPFEKLVEELRPDRRMSHTPLVQVVLALQNVPEAAADLPGVAMTPVPIGWRSAKFDLTLAARESGGALAGQAEADLDLFDPTTVRRLLGAFTTFLAGAAADPDLRLSALPLLGAAGRHQLLREWNDTAVPYPRERSIPELFAEGAARRPDAVAVRQGERWWSYGELVRRSDRVAARLAAAGVGPEVLVGLAAERSPEMVAGLLGILKAGGAYLPLDLSYPAERLGFMIEDARVPVLLAVAGSEARLPAAALERLGARVLPLEEPAPGEPEAPRAPAGGRSGPRFLAYALYTSGSTGRPKGVAVEHRSVVRLVREANFATMGEEEVFLQLAPVPFDASTLEIWGALLNGGRLELFAPGAPALAELGREVAASRVTFLWLTAGLFHQMVEEELPRLAGVRQLLAGGDVLSVPHVERVRAALAPGHALVNGYGPTEGTTFTCCHRMGPAAPGGEPAAAGAGASIPVGRPVSSTRVHLLDPSLEPVPVGVAGELCLGGDGVARGYLGRPALTAAAFVPDPFATGAPGARRYRSGDLARWLPGGEVELLGRIDGQVKLRGFRIELGEIESVLAAHPEVRTAAVRLWPGGREDRPGERRLVAYAVPSEARAPEAGALRGYLAARLPDYMVPAAVVLLDELPLTANGKVDRQALPAPEEGGEGRLAGFVPPRGPLEELVAEVWAELLPGGPVDAHDDFFDRGGHSLLATRVVSRLRQLTGVELPLRRLFERPTVAELARCLEVVEERAPALVPRPRSDRREDPPASFAQERLWFLGRFGVDRAQYNVPAPVRVTGPLEVPALARALAEMVRRHQALRTVFARRDRGGAGVVQRVLPAPGPRLPAIDLAALPAPARRAAARRLAAADARQPFDLGRGPLFRACLVRFGRDPGAEEHLLLVSMHHIVTDGWSLAVFFRELGALYGAFRQGRPSPLAEPPLQYADFAAWQRRWLSGEVLERQVAHWRARLAGAPAVLDLPTDRPRPPIQTLRGGELRVALPAELLAGLRRLSRRRGVSLFMTLLAGLQTLLGRLSGAAEVTVGAPIAGRTRAEVEELIGFFVNTLVFRGELGGDPSFAELLERTREGALDAYAHQELPFEKLVEELRPERNLSHSPLFQVMLALQNAPPPVPELPGARSAEPFEAGAVKGAKFDLTLGLAESPRGLVGELTFNRDLFDPTTARRLLAHFEHLLASAVEEPGRRLSELALLAPAARHQLLREWNDTAAPPPDDPAEATLHGPFERWAAERPDAVALIAGGGDHLSYGELDARSERLARALAERGVGPGSLVGVHLGRRPEMAVAVLAVEKAGGAYVPLDAAWPIERLRWIVAERGVRHLVTETSRLAAVAELVEHGLVHVVCCDRPSADAAAGARSAAGSGLPRAAPDDPAYVIFTSGSTGHPKGVVVRHRPAANLVSWVNRTFAVGPDDCMLFVTALSFDLSVYDLFGILAAGGTVRLASAEELEDPVRQVELLAAERVTFWDSAPAALQRLAPLFPPPRERPAEAPALRLVFLSGDWVPLSLPDRVRRSFPGAAVVALGGATEATVWSNVFPVGEIDPGWASIPYGRPIANARYHVLDRALRPCPVGVAGDLHIAGGCLSSGYAGSPRLTAESYLPDPFSDDPGAVLYRTGDRARTFADGNLEFLGRLDTQVKVRGFRIELGEIEAVLMEHPGISEAVVLAREDAPGDRRLVAYLIPSGEMPSPAEMRSWVLRKLPEYMAPSAWVERASWPLSPTGKLDRKALPPPGGEAAAVGPSPPAPAGTALERRITAVWGELLGVPSVGRDESFFDLGGHSLLLARVQERLQEELGRELPMVELFRNPTVASLAAALGDPGDGPEGEEGPREAPRRPGAGSGAIAVVGMAGRFPGARDLAELWANLRAGVESIRFFSDEELAEAGFDRELLRDPAVVKARGALDDPDLFDAAFFGYTPREAELIDPQQRLFLESAWQALEDAGHGAVGPPPRSAAGRSRVGVFGGTSESSYLHRLRSDPDLVRTVGGQQIAISNNPDYLAARVSYKLDLTGPSVAVQTACSTSLVAVHLACRSLVDGACDLALAGGSSVQAREISPYRWAEGGISSPDGHVRAFDARARGVVGGSGVGVVALKRLEDALADGDAIRAVIRGSAVNNDGGFKAGFTAPSAEGQAEAIREALAAAAVDPATVGYVEAHGTATPLGDPIEVAGLKRAFASAPAAGPRPAPAGKTCALGSIKTNIGHLDAAAGVAGLIKAVLALEHREIPPSLHFERPNPEIDFEDGPFFVADRLLPWESTGAPRRAGVSSFGIGGANAHLVLEEAPAPEGPAGGAAGAAVPPERGAELIVLSAKTEPALERAAENLAAHLAAHPELPLGDVAWSLQAGRRAFPYRRAVVCRRREEAVATLEEPDRRRAASGAAAAEPPRLAFLFPGQGAQFPGMGEALYREEPVFRAALDRCAAILEPDLGLDLRRVLYPEIDREKGARFEEAEERLAATELTQPALFAVEHALAELWASWGIAPAAMAGHSLGEVVAAARAGVFGLDDALRLVAARGRLMSSRPGGAMLAVRLGEEALAAELAGDGGPDSGLALAAVNAADACAVSGPAPAVAALRERLESCGIGCRDLRTPYAFHSPLMEPVVEPFRELVARVELRPPRVPFVSNLTGTWITAEQATDPGYWARHLRSPVRFAAGLSAILGSTEEAAGWALVEVGPGRTLSTLARRLPAATGARALVASTRHPRQEGSDRERMLAALGALWVAGVEVDWAAHHAGVRRRRVPLPTYPFERRSFWVGGGLPRRAGRPEEQAAAGRADPSGRAPGGAPEELSEVEARVAAAFRDLLGVEAGRADDFFELGGSSLMAVQLGGRLRELLGAELPSDFLLQASTPGGLAALIEARRAAEASGEAPAPASCLVPLRRTGSRRPLFLIHQVGGHVYSYRPLLQALPPAQPVYGLRSVGLEPGEEPLAGVEAMAEHYLERIREVQPRGPYRIGGASMGGMIAFEIAHRLDEAGEEVELLALMDTPCGDQMPPRPEEDWEFTAPVFLGRVALTREELVGLDAEAQLRYALDRAEREGSGAGFGLDEARRLAAVLRANVEALFAYRPRPWGGRMVFFRALEKRPGEPPRPELHWIDLARGGIEIHLVPGNHATMHEPPNVATLAARLERALAAALSPGQPVATPRG